MTDKELIGTREAARRANRCQRTIVFWIQKGQLPAYKFDGDRGPYMIDPVVLAQVVIQKTVPKPYQPPGADVAKDGK